MQMQNSRLLLAALLLRCTDGLMLAPPTRKVGTLTLSEADSTSTNFRGDDSTGTRIWDAGLVLSRILSEEPSIEGARVLELGSGTGVGGLTAAACGARVVLTDGATATLPLLEANVNVNGLADRVDVRHLRWGYEEDLVHVAALGPFDLLVGSDLLYAPEEHDSLLSTLEWLCTPGRTEVLLAYPTRFTEDLFLEMAAHAFEPVGCPEEVEPGLFIARLRLGCD
jgi:predicted nicotinamide N-methyase